LIPGRDGRLGHNNCENLDTPKQIAALQYVKVKEIVSGSAHNAAISGMLYVIVHSSLNHHQLLEPCMCGVGIAMVRYPESIMSNWDISLFHSLELDPLPIN